MLSLDLNKAAEERIQKLTSQIELVQSAFTSLEVNGPIEFTVNDHQAFLGQIAQIDQETRLNQKPVVYVMYLKIIKKTAKLFSIDLGNTKQGLNQRSLLYQEVKKSLTKTQSPYMWAVSKKTFFPVSNSIWE
ncbi:hypothetical protein GVN20_14520 [Runella sp. CRIBMP]|uniref:hypothetical protein n=1 Tax=Runella sp. CRIBMP TaxID=2683261 RepID=UPI001412ADD3|nr:hypothetical protein [Runella sp. CRIBMP]NBB20578.1 hypothetical protein [Runella sp. CRIBMP]